VLPAEHQSLYDGMRGRWVIGTPEQALARVIELAETYAVHEVMVHPVAGSYADADGARAESRERTLELLAAG
jgi:alkanesulfonate monooxygenase SsuD/methylene tetrahydromethanopterin reductase-like flavin-dependent oxidoreductase (luciferase family)